MKNFNENNKYTLKYILKYILIFALAMLLFMIPFIVKAEQLDLDEFFNDLDEMLEMQSVSGSDTQVINEVSAEANTGGNTAEAGEVVVGEASASARTKTIINGEVVEEINIEKTSTKDVDIQIESQIIADSDTVEVMSTTTVDGQVENTALEAPLAEQEENEPKKQGGNADCRIALQCRKCPVTTSIFPSPKPVSSTVIREG